MGSVLGRASDQPPPSPANAPPHSAVLAPAEDEESEKVDYTKLPCPIPYEDLHLEATSLLYPYHFEGLKIILINELSERFRLGHKVVLESVEAPYAHQIIKVSTGSYEFGATFFYPKLILAGSLNTNGLVDARVRCDFTSNFNCKLYAKLTDKPHCSEAKFQFDYKGKDYRSQFQFGNNGFYSVNYIQSVTPNLSLGTELLRLGEQSKTNIGFAARYTANKMIANARVLSGGAFVFSYIQKLSEKASLASDFIYMHDTRALTSSFGYQYKFRECLLWGKVDCNAVISAYLERKISTGTSLVLSAELDHVKKNYKFGYGLEFVSRPSYKL